MKTYFLALSRFTHDRSAETQVSCDCAGSWLTQAAVDGEINNSIQSRLISRWAELNHNINWRSGGLHPTFCFIEGKSTCSCTVRSWIMVVYATLNSIQIRRIILKRKTLFLEPKQVNWPILRLGSGVKICLLQIPQIQITYLLRLYHPCIHQKACEMIKKVYICLHKTSRAAFRFQPFFILSRRHRSTTGVCV